MVNQKQIAPFGLRMPQELKQWVHQKAQENRRSTNSEIVVRLEESRRAEETPSKVHEGM